MILHLFLRQSLKGRMDWDLKILNFMSHVSYLMSTPGPGFIYSELLKRRKLQVFSFEKFSGGGGVG